MALQQELRVNARTTTGGQARYSAELAKKLESGVASLDTNQSPAQFKQELTKLKTWAIESKKKVAEAYNAKYPEGEPPPETPPAPRPGLGGAPRPPAAAPQPAAEAAVPMVLTARNPKTGERIVSRDGGLTWQPVK
jgi:hypothetical protein